MLSVLLIAFRNLIPNSNVCTMYFAFFLVFLLKTFCKARCGEKMLQLYQRRICNRGLESSVCRQLSVIMILAPKNEFLFQVEYRHENKNP